MSSPELSVVMSVYNGVASLPETLDSVLSQHDVDFEFIVVDDGSHDGASDILDEYAAHDLRLRVIHQENMGLTRALIRGCEMARAEFIARQDAGGDLSLPNRFSTQLKILKEHEDVVMVSSATRFVGPGGEWLFDVSQDRDVLQQGLRRLNIKTVKGPSSHPSTMFRRNAYEAVGGYRSCFRVAQDLDLWLRLAERGRCQGIPELGYQTMLSPDSISGSRRSEQIKMTHHILECARRRRAGQEEETVLRRIDNVSKQRKFGFTRISRSQALYFIGRCLHQQYPDKARRYYQQAVRAFPLNPKALWRLIG